MPSCELCGSDKGEEYKPTSVPEFGRAMEIAVAQVPHACECVCRKCKDNLKKYGEKKIVMNEKRHKAYKKEAARREEHGLCWKCGGKINVGSPCMVYEGCYETTHTCTHCGDKQEFT